MRLAYRCSLPALALLSALRAQDPACPAYPASVRTEIESSIELDRQAAEGTAGSRQAAAVEHLGDDG